MRKGLSVIAVVAILLFAFSANVYAGTAPGDSNLVSWWKFDESSGTNAADAEGTNPGVTKNMEDGDWISGKSGNALNFDGNDEYVQVSDSASLDITDKLTIEAWVKFPDLAKDGIVVGKGYSYSLKMFNWGTETENVGFSMLIDGEWRYIGPCPAISTGVWHHIAGTYDSATNIGYGLYIDGSLASTETLTGLNSYTITPDNESLGIGSDTVDWGQYFEGTIDEVRIWNRVLTSDEVAWCYDNPGLIPEPSTLLLMGAGLLGLLSVRRIKAKR